MGYVVGVFPRVRDCDLGMNGVTEHGHPIKAQLLPYDVYIIDKGLQCERLKLRGCRSIRWHEVTRVRKDQFQMLAQSLGKRFRVVDSGADYKDRKPMALACLRQFGIINLDSTISDHISCSSTALVWAARHQIVTWASPF